MFKKKIVAILIVVIMLVIILNILPMLYFQNIRKQIKILSKSYEKINIFSYNLIDVINSAYCSINIQEENGYCFLKECKIQVEIKNYNSNNTYKLEYGTNLEKLKTIDINSEYFEEYIELNEGKNEIFINFYCNNKLINSKNKTIYHIEPYKEQFLDEFSSLGISTHFLKGYDNIEKCFNQLKYLGIKNIRNSIRWDSVSKNDKYDFSSTDTWVEKIEQTDINIIAILMSISKEQIGDDFQISNKEEREGFEKYANMIISRYPNIKLLEIWNEPNVKWKTEESFLWYSNIVKDVKFINKDKTVIAASTAVPYSTQSETISSEDFIKEISERGSYKNSDAFSCHIYSNNNNMKWLDTKTKSHRNVINEIGGFQKLYITEYGIKSNINNISEKERASRIIKQTTLNNANEVQISILYNFIDDSEEMNYGLLYKNYIPKDSYYIIKQYCNNFNGSEYIGTLNIAEGLESHIYDKDGKPKIIAWSNNTSKDIQIPYENFEAKDIYGEKIENTDGTLTITTSPVYLDNVEEKYFYQAISNTALENYEEFEEKFAEQLLNLPELNLQIQNLKQQMQQIGTSENKIQEETTKTLMQRHFQLGDSLINAYQNGRIQIEKVKLSSMLDMLNDIGNSFEDLVTVTATTRNAEISKAKDRVNEIENIIETNSDIEIIYPAKILEFSKDFQEKAEYINSLEEENDIKTGLIVSKNLHSIYLSNWAKEFCNIYIDEYLKNNLIPETYSQKDITNQDVTVTLNIGNDAQITNNDGNNQHTFTENGEFTFEYERRGRNFRQTVKVENIDKQAPNITGVEDGKVYENSAKPIVKDDNLETVKLILDGRLIENYINNTELEEEGTYRIEAEDKAGNKTIVSFEIKENISKDYIVEENQIKNIEANTTVNEFKQKVELKIQFTLLREGQILNDTDVIATGDILELENATQYTLGIRGDLDKDGKITIKDLILLKQQISKELELEEIQQIAGDIDFNGKIDERDIVKLRRLILTSNE